MLRIIPSIQIDRKFFFREIIKKKECDYVRVMWKRYKRYSFAGIKRQLEEND